MAFCDIQTCRNTREDPIRGAWTTSSFHTCLELARRSKAQSKKHQASISTYSSFPSQYRTQQPKERKEKMPNPLGSLESARPVSIKWAPHPPSGIRVATPTRLGCCRHCHCQTTAVTDCCAALISSGRLSLSIAGTWPRPLPVCFLISHKQPAKSGQVETARGH